MSLGGRAESIGFLRASVARIEAGSPVPGGRGGGLCEVLPAAAGDAPAATAFALSLARRRAGASGPVIWISDEMTLVQRGAVYAPGLRFHGLAAAQIVLVRAMDARAALWAMEEALCSPAPAVVIGEVWDAARHCDLRITRRFLLAARAGGALGVLLHPAPAPGALSTAARDRFEVRALPGRWRTSAGDRRPIFGAPAWQARRLKGQEIVLQETLQETLQENPQKTTNNNREPSGVALSQPLHQRRASA